MAHGTKVVILVEDMFNIYEFWYPYYRLKEAGVEVTVVGTGRKNQFTGKPATEVSVDANAEDVSAADFDGIIIPGGYAPDMMRRSPAMVKLVADFDKAGKLVAAICHAGWMLASADVLRGRNVTSFFAIKDDMVNAGAEWQDAAVVVDNNMVTSRTPDDLPVFMPAILKVLEK
jgi:protease I